MSSSSSGPRSFKIDPDERTGWSSERPRRPGDPERPPRKVDVSTRNRVLAPAERMRYSPGSLLLVVGPDTATVDELCARLVEEKAALLSLSVLRRLIAGKVPAAEVDAKAEALREAVAKKRLASGESVVVAIRGLDAEEREHWVRLAHAHRRPRHLLFVDAGAADIDDQERAELNALRKALETGALGEEGFATATRLAGKAILERRRVVFAPPPKDD